MVGSGLPVTKFATVLCAGVAAGCVLQRQRLCPHLAAHLQLPRQQRCRRQHQARPCHDPEGSCGPRPGLGKTLSVAL